jgi:hypothetical protein
MPLKINCLSGFRAAFFGPIFSCLIAIQKIFLKFVRFFLPAALIFAELHIVMNANEFLPPPVRLSQASDLEKFSGGASGSEITRRSFLKRTGGATVATLVAWNLASKQAEAMSNLFSDISDATDWDEHILICNEEPTPETYRSTWQVVDTSNSPNQAWRTIPHVDISNSVGSVDKEGHLKSLADPQGNGYSFFLLHWLTYGEVIHRGDFVAACVPGGEMKSRITAHAAVVMGKWTYRLKLAPVFPSGPAAMSYEKVEYVYNTILRAAADEDIGIVKVDGNHPDEGVRVRDSGGLRSPWLQVKVNNVTTGWVQVSLSFAGRELGLGGKSCGQRFTSVAGYIPKYTLKTLSETYSSGINLALSLQGTTGKEGGATGTGGVNGGWTMTTTLQQGLEVNSPPNTVDFVLNWDHAIWKTQYDIKLEPKDPMPTPRDVGTDLPPEAPVAPE